MADEEVGEFIYKVSRACERVLFIESVKDHQEDILETSQDSNYTWLRHETWYSEMIHGWGYEDVRSKRMKLGNPDFHDMAIFFAQKP